MSAIYLVFRIPHFSICHLPHFSSFLRLCFWRENCQFSHWESVSGASPFQNIQYQFLTRCSPLKLLFLPCFSVQESFSLISKCHCYRPNLPKSASPTVHWHHTPIYRFRCTLHHTSSLFWRDPRPAVRHVIAGVATTWYNCGSFWEPNPRICDFTGSSVDFSMSGNLLKCIVLCHKML